MDDTANGRRGARLAGLDGFGVPGSGLLAGGFVRRVCARGANGFKYYFAKFA
jgi:hypothetical protein